MNRGIYRCLGLVTILALLMAMVPAVALANPPYPDPTSAQPKAPVIDKVTGKPVKVKALDQPNPLDALRNAQRLQATEAGNNALASTLALTGTDRVLVILVEFAGTDVFTWTQGVSAWDPLGISDPNETVYDDNGNPVYGDCSNIITQTKTFTYTNTLHNAIPRPVSATDSSGTSIWTPDFSPAWYNGFMFGAGVTFNYTRTDNSVVNVDFSGKSVKQYYSDASAGRYDIEGDVIGWLPVNHSTWYYGADACPGARSAGTSTISDTGIPDAGTPRDLVMDALDAVNAISNTIPGFDWANYDTNGDGVIDRLWIVHSGYGEEDSTTLLNRTNYGESAVWSHSSSIPLYEVAPGISAGPYIIMPENGGIGVFAHESAHNLGVRDLYAYGAGEASAGFWTLMADDWTGYPIGFEPPMIDPFSLDAWGWLDPKVIFDPNQVYQVTLGQASSFPGGAGVYRGVKIQLPDGSAPLAVPVWQGSYYWWGGKQDLANGTMTLNTPIVIPSGATLSFDMAYGTEQGWDFLWVQASTDGGSTWKTITNTDTTCVHDPGWIGEEEGFPADLCAAGLGGFTGYNASFPSPDTETFNLSAFAGKNVVFRFWYMTDWGTTYEGPFIDNVSVKAGANTLFADNAETVNGNWALTAPFVRSNGTKDFSQNLYLQWRNVSPTGGYDASLADPRWRYGPANTGMLVWYNNNFYSDNEIFNYLTDWPGYGPKGVALVVDSHPDPIREPNMVAAGFNNEGGNIVSRSLMRDAPFSLNATVPFNMSNSYPYTSTVFTSSFLARPQVSTFQDAIGYYPGAELASRGPGYVPLSYKWITKQWDASVVMPSKAFYGIKAPGYVGTGDGQQEMRFDCASTSTGRLGCYYYGVSTGLGYDGGTGNPVDAGGDYGWQVQILNQSASMATVQIWNTHYKGALMPDRTWAFPGTNVAFNFSLPNNAGGDMSMSACIPLDLTKMTYVAGSASGGAIPLTGACSSPLPDAATASTPAADVQAIGWYGNVVHGGAANFGFSINVNPLSVGLAALNFVNRTIALTLQADVNGLPAFTVPSEPVVVEIPAFRAYLPIVLR